MLALALADQWQRMGAPASVDLVELGPGRGALMADVLRIWQRAAPSLLAAARVTLVEASERLRAEQKRALAAHADRLAWSDRLPGNGRPLFLIANEFFDALPVRQFVRTAEGWRERLVNWSEARGFHQVLGPVTRAMEEPEGDLWEHSAESMDWASRIGERLAADGGLALIVDYANRPGESSFRGIARHGKADPLVDLGAVDLSAGVDFPALTSEAGGQGAIAYGPVGQGSYLRALGIQTRHAQLAARATPGQRRELDAALERLTDAQAMGEEFRVLALTGPDNPPPAGFAAQEQTGSEEAPQCS